METASQTGQRLTSAYLALGVDSADWDNRVASQLFNTALPNLLGRDILSQIEAKPNPHITLVYLAGDDTHLFTEQCSEHQAALAHCFRDILLEKVCFDRFNWLGASTLEACQVLGWMMSEEHANILRAARSRLWQHLPRRVPYNSGYPQYLPHISIAKIKAGKSREEDAKQADRLPRYDTWIKISRLFLRATDSEGNNGDLWSLNLP